MLEDEDSDRIEKICPVCKVEATKRCSRCALVYYCSVEHQQQHWKTHKTTCNPFKVFSNEQYGRFLVATRDIRVGEVVIKEPPLVHGPAQITGPVCVGCLQGLQENKYLECEQCGWPVCKRSCQDNPAHRAECKLTIGRGSKIAIQHFYVPHPMYQCLMPLRCLLLAESDPAKWELLQQLESHEEERRGSELWRNDREGVAKLIPRFFKCENRWDEDEILRIVGIIQVNGHEIPLNEPSSVAIYNQASMLEHSCRPNLSKSFTNRGEIVLWAPNPIKRGERLSICYTDVMWTTGNRLEHLLQTKMFRCECERCSDPTEYETYFSALRCSGFQKDSKCKGYILPVDDDGWTKSGGDWSCQKCHSVVTGAAVNQILERARMDLEAMQKHREDHCNKYMKHYSKWLTPNHQYLVDVKISLSQVIGGKAPEAIKKIPYEKLMTKIKICQDLITLFEKICPAEARAFGATRFELHAALAELARRSTESNNPACTSQLEESLYNANECIRMLLHEPAVLMESKICAQAKMNAEALKSLLGIKE
ncbi:SET domain-containing protein SmydA-8-like [Anopheles aquasalis]|uniref:SET domain-containing protein SmydA-8-like n=1 Tax=Anopheles aquasalis TaxID=42839 RepID=UPI00215B67B3|nr:SET domain-containing protein SmydA-8-like [Anopheles aquasalis]